MTDWGAIARFAGALPEAEEGLWYGQPAYKVRGKTFVRVHRDRQKIDLRVDREEREFLVASDPDVFLPVDAHYFPHPWVIARLERMPERLAEELLEDAWKLAAPDSLHRLLPSLPDTR